jgi:hypothetical protein
VTVTWDVEDLESAISSSNGCDPTTINTDTAGTTLTCEATSAGGTSSQSVTIKRDATDPTIDGNATTSPNGNGWYKNDVTVHYVCDDNLSGVASCELDQTLSAEGANQSTSGTATDNAGNSASDTVSGINIDKTKPSVVLVGGPSNGSSYVFGTVPDAPTCQASDALSGLDGTCQVSGYSTAVGTHTVSATATDKAGNTNSVSRTYTVDPYTLNGFFQPVDMGIKGNTDLGPPYSGSPTNNTARAGQTIPLKFEIFQGATELTDTSAVKTFVQKVSCGAVSGTVDSIETYSSGSTTLRYDFTSGQYIFNWQTPKTAEECYKVTMTAQDNSFLTAYFTLKK